MKAQLLSTDLMVAVLILLVIVGALGIIVFEYSSFGEQQALNRDMELKGQEAINTLTLTEGDKNWQDYTSG